ncbi:SRPBCC family protein [Streptomyces sp. DH8]|uniref:SRPBCC family protein n=1 Tax=Streptomyces sp. DH8 TaxID=2857008 RepID=UPI001E56B5DB|nr:SRPBCC family protein [Streptomyces sp. DH8]
MAARHHLIDRSPSAVWAVFEDASLYGRWVVGTSESRPEQGHWPEVGSSLVYCVRLGPKEFTGRTVVRRIEKPHTLELEAEAGALGSARIALEVRPWGDKTLVTVDEHPLRGVGGTLHNFLLDSLIQIRHRAMLARLARLTERMTPPGADAAGRRPASAG